MIAATIDTNVLASGITGLQNPLSTLGAILRAWRDDKFDRVTSEHILRELPRTLAKRYFQLRLSAEQIQGTQDWLRAQAQITIITIDINGVATQPKDVLILATAVSAHADYLVTGDRKLVTLGSYEGVCIVTPREFLDIIQP